MDDQDQQAKLDQEQLAAQTSAPEDTAIEASDQGDGATTEAVEAAPDDDLA